MIETDPLETDPPSNNHSVPPSPATDEQPTLRAKKKQKTQKPAKKKTKKLAKKKQKTKKSGPNGKVSDPDRIVMRDASALALARLCLRHARDRKGRPTIARWTGAWWQWQDGHHREIEDEDMRARLWKFLERVDVKTTDEEGVTTLKRLDVTSHRVSEVSDAMTSVCDRVNTNAELPFALAGYDGPALRGVAIVRNGLLELGSGKLHAPTPRLFATAGAAVDYKPNATCPEWERFLEQIFTDADDSTCRSQPLDERVVADLPLDVLDVVRTTPNGFRSVEDLARECRVKGARGTVEDFEAAIRAALERGTLVMRADRICDRVDRQSIRLVQQIFGWALANDTSRHKIPLFVGPTRSGKSTMMVILRELLGTGNVCAPLLSSLGDRFGLAQLLGKSLAIIPDARLGTKADQVAIAGLLLAASGHDTVTIDRKNIRHIETRLRCLIMIASNELPRFTDASGALADRFLVVETCQSFLGREDLELEGRLKGELPGILRWALEGWRDLVAHGWAKPERAQQTIDELARLGSPIKAFVADRTVFVAGALTSIDVLYAEWGRWCEANGRKEPGTKQIFGRDLHAAVPKVKTSRPRKDGEDERDTVYHGIALRTQRTQ